MSLFLSGTPHSLMESQDCEPPKEWLENVTFRRFYGQIKAGCIYLNQLGRSLLTTGRPPEQFHPIPLPSSQAQEPTSAPVCPQGNGVTLEMLFERFHADPKRQTLREGTRDEYKFIYRALREQIGGERLLSTIGREDVRAVAETFRYLPARSTLTNRRDLLKDIAAKAKEEGQPQAHVKTYNKRVQSVSAIFNYAVNEMLISQNPAKNLSMPEPKSSGEEKGFSTGQLQRIFADQTFLQFTGDGEDKRFRPNHPDLPCLFWVPLIGLFHGMRSNEILQLQVKNVFRKDGVMVLRTEGEVKNHRAYRSVPLHPLLERAGFLSYVEEVRKAGYEQLFPDAKQAAYGKYSNWFQKHFSRCLVRAGVKEGRKECFHALRHTWNGELRRVGVPEEIRRTLGGWKDAVGSSESNYGPTYLPSLLRDLEKVEYPELDLSHLFPRKEPWKQ